MTFRGCFASSLLALFMLCYSLGDEIQFNGEDTDFSFRRSVGTRILIKQKKRKSRRRRRRRRKQFFAYKYRHSRSPFGLCDRCPVMPTGVEFFWNNCPSDSLNRRTYINFLKSMETYATIFSGFRLLSAITKEILTQSSREPDSKATTKRHQYPPCIARNSRWRQPKALRPIFGRR